MKRVCIINGPNLNLTGKRETDIYGSETFEGLLVSLKDEFPGVEVLYYQSNIEGEIITKVQEWGFNTEGIILNAGAYTHTSVGIGDAVRAISAPVIEVHLSNILSREEYRHISYIAPSAVGIISGFGLEGYRMALRYFAQRA
jgi:3-dehydroquinate dehydratase-2